MLPTSHLRNREAAECLHSKVCHEHINDMRVVRAGRRADARVRYVFTVQTRPLSSCPKVAAVLRLHLVTKRQTMSQKS